MAGLSNIGGAIGSAVTSAGNAVSNAGSQVGTRKAAPAPRAPSGGGGGGSAAAAPASSDGVDWATLAALSNAGLSSSDILALGSGGGGAAPAQTSASLDSGFNGSSDPSLNLSVPTLPEAPGMTTPSYLSDPNYLAAIAAIDLGLGNTESGFRRQESDLQRDYDQGMPMFNNTWDDNRTRLRNAYEARGLLKSGETEDAVGKTYTQQGDALSRMQNALTSNIGNIEQQIAQARAAAAQQRTGAALQYQNAQPLS